DRIASARATDEAEAQGKTILVMRSVLTGEETERRIADATALTVFGNVVRLDLDTVRLREITTTLIERYYRKPPDDDKTPPAPSGGAPAPSGGPAPSGSSSGGDNGAAAAPSSP